MSVRALWVPYEVDSLRPAIEFYTDHLGLSIVDTFAGGAVLRVADAAFVELSTRTSSPPPPLAIELSSDAAVDETYRRFGSSLPGPRRYPRGHYGFEVDAPAGARVMVWSER